MMRYTVVWSAEASDQLAQLWLDAPDQSSVTTAADAIDVQLSTTPQTKGAALREGLRVLEIPPLHILYSVAEPDRMVHAALVRRVVAVAPPSHGNGQTKS